MAALREFVAAGVDSTLRLSDGRALGFAEYGDPDGKPVLFLHGIFGSRYWGRVTAEAAARQGLRVIAPDRPGMGLSDYKPRRSIVDWPKDVAEVADQLGLGRFAVIGHSGGGPYVCACAAALPDRLTAAVIVSGWGGPGSSTKGVPRMQRIFMGLARVSPGLYGWLMGAMTRQLQGDRGRLLREMTRELNGRDQEALAQPEVAASFTDAMFEAVRPGFMGVALDVALINRPWRLRLQDVPMRVRLWHGEEDRWVPVSMGRYVAAALGRCDATFVPGEGHISLLVDHLDEILKELC